ncbi:MAG: glutamine-hydrolyzing carbamoyl-phosphate synthase small subunit [Candidatus Lokiarchaeota archaeon]|nr:glutamine-hydrolyzing carbamoyl-phosphate synthase small subunit [Candidatus Lokiarchaeota archaeon]
MNENRKAVLVLEDGTYFEGIGFGSTKEVNGEFVFNTGMVGYPESMTDPSYKGQILTFTYPLIGNYGIPNPDIRDKWNIPKFFESDGFDLTPDRKISKYTETEEPDFIKPSGFVIHELCKKPHHWNSCIDLDTWMKHEGVPGIEGVDTRELTKRLRIKGVMLGILKVCDYGEDYDITQLKEKAKKVKDPNKRNLVAEVSIKEPIIYENNGPNIVLIDLGTKLNIIRNLLSHGFRVIRVPYEFSPEEVLEYKPDGILVSNGPGDPKNNTKTIKTIRFLIENNFPYMGICLGNQLLALALGGDTYKLKYGHRSQNQPVVNTRTNECCITTQNHGYAPYIDSLEGTGLKVSLINANDKTNEGLSHKTKKVFSVQFHPENYPGPMDAAFLFNKFKSLVI